MATAAMGSSDELAPFIQALGPEAVSVDAGRRALLSQDIWSAPESDAEVVLSPSDTAGLSRALSACAAHGWSVSVRGGGMSYTGGYLPQGPRTALLDLGRMDKILEIDPARMTVTVEAGCAWARLHETLRPLGLRTPFWGPLSGLASTVGGGVSQLNAVFGAGQHGTTSESVVALKIALADGEILTTGARGGGAHPFYRHYGPDLTGLFCGDCGAFGVKAEITLRLIRAPAHEAYASFRFAGADALFAAAAEVTREGITSELIGFDPGLAEVRLRRASILSGVKALAAVAARGSGLRGAAGALRTAVAGRSFLGVADWSLHAVCEGRSQAGVDADMKTLRRLAAAAGGEEVEASIPRVLRAQPFAPLNSILGPDGERWVPVHGIVSLADAAACRADLEAAFAARREAFGAAGIGTGMMLTTLSTNAFLIEPVFFWPEARRPIHEATVEPSLLARLPRHAANPEATALVAEARKAAIAVFERHGAAHFQIGRAYPWLESRDAASRRLARAVKSAVDPAGRLSPGVLGL